MAFAPDSEGKALRLEQLRRTAQWLRSLPLNRFDRDGGRIEREARALIEATVNQTRAVCDACEREATSGARLQDCPPPDAELLRVGRHGLGDQLQVVTGELERVLLECAAPGEGRQAPQSVARNQALLAEGAALESQALDLRRLGGP